MAIPRRLWALRGERPRFVALSALTAAVLLVWPVVDVYLRAAGVGIPFGFNDWGVYSGTVQSWREGGAVYVQTEAGGYHGSYLYPPVTLLAYVPFAGFEFKTGAILFGGFSLALLWVGLAGVAKVLGYELGVVERLGLLVALFGFQPALRDFKWGQAATLLAGLLCLAFYAHELGARENGRPSRYASGVLTTLGSGFKLFVATSGAHLLRDRDRFLGAMGAAGVLAVASVAVFGVETHLAYLDVLLWGKGWGKSLPPSLWDTSSAYRPLYVLGGLALPVRVAGIVGVIGLTVAARDDDSESVRRATFALGVAVAPVLAPLVASNDLVLYLLPAVILLAVELDAPDGRPWIPVGAVLGFHLHRYVVELAVNPPGWLPLAELVSREAAWLQPGMWATVLLVGLAAYRVAEGARLRALRP